MMKILIVMMALLMMLASCASIKNPASIQYKNTKTNNWAQRADTVLIAGRGEMPTRLFLDKLFDALSVQLKGKDIICQYRYLGADANDLYRKLETLTLTEHCNVLLLIDEVRSPSVQTHSEDYNLGGGLRARENVLRYYQTFTIMALLPGKLDDTLWESEMQVSIDFTKDIYYQKIATLIFESMENNRMID